MTWLYLPCECLNSAPASEGLASASTLPDPERAQSLTWRGKHMPQQHWSRAWKRVIWLRLLSGLTLPPSTLEHGAGRWIASCREIPASPTALPESGAARMTTVSLSNRSSASTTKAGLVVSSARPSRGTQTDNSRRSSHFWSDWVAALRSESSRRPRSAPAIDESDCSSWPTARAEDSESAGRRHGRDVSDTLTAASRDFADTWPTARTGRGAYTRDNGDPSKERPTLEGAAENWPTITANDSKRGWTMARRRAFFRVWDCIIRRARGRSAGDVDMREINRLMGWD